MISFNVTNRFTGAVQFTAEIDCDEDAPKSVKLGLSVKWANLWRADLSRAYLSGAYLSGADLSRANLSGANLSQANLSRAYLSVANLSRANLSGHKLIRKVAQVRRDDGYEFIGFAIEGGGLLVRAGCRTFLMPEFRAHVAKGYPNTPKAAETTAILDFIQACFDAQVSA